VFAYIVRRLLLMVPTLVGIMVVNFALINMAPGGPIEQLMARLRAPDGGQAGAARTREVGADSRAARGLDPEMVAALRKQLGLDKPPLERFWQMMKNYATFDFGESFFKNRRVSDLVVEKLPVSISIGLWATLLTYVLCIPLGIAKAVRDGTRFDAWSSTALIVANSLPSFVLALLLVILTATGTFVTWFPLRGLVSDGWEALSLGGKILDYLWHLVLPVTALTVTGLASLALLTKNSFIEEIRKQYATTARAKGIGEHRVLYGHVFRNAMLLVVAGLPAALVGALFAGAFLIEIVFSLDGLGRLGFESMVNRDYPVVFATIYFFSLIGLMVRLLGDLTYVLVDPRIDFEARAR
jgi:microcin C transport system permease protein